jgi:molybdopterin-guanine dinucleotide biosynthesis protein A
MLERVLTAVADAAVRVVVGPPDLPVPAGVLLTREEPPGAGPVAGAAAGTALVPRHGIGTIALLAADLPMLDAPAVTILRSALERERHADVAVFVDGDGHRQTLCALWRSPALRDALSRLPTAAGAPVRALFAETRVAEVTWAGAGPPPWFDCDTDADLRRAEEWADERARRVDRGGVPRA